MELIYMVFCLLGLPHQTMSSLEAESVSFLEGQSASDAHGPMKVLHQYLVGRGSKQKINEHLIFTSKILH